MSDLIIGYIGYFDQIDIHIFIISLLFVIGATSLFKKGLGKMARVGMGIGIYLFARGIITTGMLLAWWEQVPEIINALFLLPL